MGDKTSKCEYSSVQEEAFPSNEDGPEDTSEVPDAGEDLYPIADVPVEMPYLEPESSMVQEGNEKVEEAEAGEEVELPPEEELPPNEQPLLPLASGNDPN